MFNILTLILFSFFISVQTDSEWTVASFNIRYDNPNDPLTWNERKQEVANAVAYFNIVGFQEVLPNQLEDLQTLMPWMAHYSRGREADGSGEACPIFWQRDKYDLMHSETRWLAEFWQEEGEIGWDAQLPRIASIVTLYQRSTGKVIKVINSHWSHVSSEARVGSAELINSWSNSRNVDAVIVLGDFNAEDTDTNVLTSALRGLIDGKRVYANLIDDEFTEREYPHIEANFKADLDGTGVPTFIIESGEWTIADVRIEISHEDGFSPDNYLAFIPIDKSIDDDVLTFRVEFENPNNEPSSIEASES